MEKSKQELSPNEIVRFRDGGKYFGFRPTQLRKKIDEGEIPVPLALTDNGRAVGWLGRQILEHQAKLVADAKRKEKGR